MSKKSGQAAFATKSMFDVLGEDQPEEEEVEEESEDLGVDQAIEEKKDETVAISKSARKRLARQTAKAAAAPPVLSPGFKDEALQAVSAKSKQNGGSKGTSLKDSESGAASIKSIESESESSSSPSADDIKEVVNENVSAVKSKVEETASKAKDVVQDGLQKAQASISSTKKAAPEPESPTPAPSVPKTEPVEIKSSLSSSSKKSSEKRSQSPPSSNSFSPSLPSSLPAPSAKDLPSNRKRKAPQDFTPSGPGTPTGAPTSPVKNGVKFEDGVAPGEGKEGERTIPVKKNQNMIERTVWTFIMIFGFIGLLCAGHPYMILLVLVCQTLVYKEVTALFDLRDHGGQPAGPEEEKDKWSKSLNWYFFVVANYFFYGESIIYYFKHIVFVDAYFLPFARNHRFISFMLYTVGFVGFVANLQRQHLRQQFALFCWVHISLFIVVVSSHFIVNSILEGLIWFFVPASLVICNDVMAYVCGKAFGRTPLIKLSPKKTVEGFIGAFFCTLLFSLAWGTFFMRFPYMTCPARDLGANVLSDVICKPNPVFVWRQLQLAAPIQKVVASVLGHVPTLHYAPFQIHCLVMATFASLVAPFGGFFASGFKRAFNIKDFGHSIPGHGGMTDRMDCQFMMGIFAYTYYSSLIRIQNVSPGSILQTVVTSLTLEEQLELLSDLKKFLVGQGVRV